MTQAAEVAILGSGPAALLAALAAEQSGRKPVIFAKGEKSKMFGAMYLHRAIPGLSLVASPDFEIEIIKTGSKEGYAYNVYGAREAPVSWEKFQDGAHDAWDMKAHYDALWDRYSPDIKTFEIDERTLGSICNNYSAVFCSIPAEALCTRAHEFHKQDIWVVHGPAQHLIEGVNDDNIMYYNGVPYDGSFAAALNDKKYDDEQGFGATFMRGHSWYRFSQINKYQAWEYAKDPEWAWQDDLPGRELGIGVKPLWTTCACWAEYPSFHRIGRFGRWQKGILTHHAYEQALEVCRAV